MTDDAYALAVASTEKSIQLLTELMQPSCEGMTLLSSDSTDDARKILAEKNVGLLVINVSTNDLQAEKLAIDAACNTSAVILLLIKKEMITERVRNAEKYGVQLVEKPLHTERFRITLAASLAAFRRVAYLSQENQVLKRKMEELRVIDRAKVLLVQVLNMTEPQAHRFIEKQAMDMRQSRAEVAIRILKTYEDR